MNDISIWCLDLTHIAPEPMRALLNDAERARAKRFRMPGDVARFVKSRGALRRILTDLTGRDARALTFAEGDGRKPALVDEPSIEFNLSHSGDFALIAVGSQPIGVDIEAIRDLDWRALAELNFHSGERAVLASLSGAAARDAFFQLWTHKEAYLKATGIGLTDRLTAIAVPLEGGLVSVPQDMPAGWHATPLTAPDGYKASLVGRDPPLTLRPGAFQATAAAAFTASKNLLA